MEGLMIFRLRFLLRVLDLLGLDPQSGSALRGAYFHALLKRFCAMPQEPACATCPINRQCPVATLVAPMRDETPRGRDVPRPFALRPPLLPAQHAEGVVLKPGEDFTFELILIGAVAQLFPYVVQAALSMESDGVGRYINGHRGRFTVERIEAVAPGDAPPVPLYQRDQPKARMPDAAITPAQITARASALPVDRLRLRFMTPMRLVAQGKLVHTPDPAVLLARLAERLDALERAYLPVPQGVSAPPASGRWRAVAQDAQVAVEEVDTHWVDIQSHSTRQGHATPIGGFVGTATFTGNLALSLREMLVWGELLHVGKDVVKGNGWYVIET